MSGSHPRGENEAVRAQRERFAQTYSHGSREHLLTNSEIVRYLVRWRLTEAMSRLENLYGARLRGARVLVVCAGDGLEGSILADLGFSNVTVSDLTEEGVNAALARDPRLKGVALDSMDTGLEPGSFDVVVAQDGLHHLPSPVQGFVEMLRVANQAALFLEPHDSVSGRLLGRDWEVEGQWENYVFRWNRRLVRQVANSYLGRDQFVDASFSFWHHNVHLARIGENLGPEGLGLNTLRLAKALADGAAGQWGNQFCGLILKSPLR